MSGPGAGEAGCGAFPADWNASPDAGQRRSTFVKIIRKRREWIQGCPRNNVTQPCSYSNSLPSVERAGRDSSQLAQDRKDLRTTRVQTQWWLCSERHLSLSWQRCGQEQPFPRVKRAVVVMVPVPLMCAFGPPSPHVDLSGLATECRLLCLDNPDPASREAPAAVTSQPALRASGAPGRGLLAGGRGLLESGRSILTGALWPVRGASWQVGGASWGVGGASQRVGEGSGPRTQTAGQQEEGLLFSPIS